MRTIKILAVVASFALLAGCTNLPTTDINLRPNSQVVRKDGVEALFIYKEDNQWDYEISSDLPTPCHLLKVNVEVMESYPEQVSATAEIANENPEVACAQVITPRTEKGSFQASEQAKFDLQVYRY